MRHPVIILHGYSDKPESADQWRTLLAAHGYNATEIHVGGYVSLSNEVTIKDVAEGFDLALRSHAKLNPDQPFDAIVHSTGMLVIRAWLTSYGLKGAVGQQRRSRLKRLIGIAPATFGSPMAHKGRSWVGALVKGTKKVGHPDFLEAGDQVLSALELGSKYTWDLAHLDLLQEVYDDRDTSPYPFILIGTNAYGGIRKVANEPGTDGTVRWAGCGFNTRKIVLDLSTDPTVARQKEGERAGVETWGNALVPLAFVAGHDHGTIFTDPSKPGPELVDAVVEALEVDTPQKYTDWAARYAGWTEAALPPQVNAAYQQFVTRVVDERGDPVPDYFIELRGVRDGRVEPVEEFEEDVHSWREDASYRCFHVNLNALKGVKDLLLYLSARSGTRMVKYSGCNGDVPSSTGNDELVWDAKIPIPQELTAEDGRTIKLFYPFTTTLLEIRLNREPAVGKKGDVFWFEELEVTSQIAGV